VVVSPSGFANAGRYWVNDNEVAHVDDSSTVDVD
jgi:hypothetical protein